MCIPIIDKEMPVKLLLSVNDICTLENEVSPAKAVASCDTLFSIT